MKNPRSTNFHPTYCNTVQVLRLTIIHVVDFNQIVNVNWNGNAGMYGCNGPASYFPRRK